MRYLIGLLLTILSGVLTAVTGFTPLSIIMFIGVFMFASLPSDDVFFDYRIVNSDELILRKRYYLNFFPFTIISFFLTLGNASLKIVCKEEYFRAPINVEKTEDLIKIPRKEYIAIRNEQRNIYSTQVLSKEFMTSSYTEAEIGFKRKKIRLIIVSIIASIMLTLLTMPGGFFPTLISESIFIPMIFLWIPEYKDAKILQQAYDKSLNSTTNITNN